VLPKLPQRLPRAVLNTDEAEAVLARPDVSLPEGLRDRAMLELLYSTGLRRAELAGLLLFDVDATRGTVFVREGKGRKDRVVPAGERALAWTLKYLEEARPKLAGARDEGVLFLGDAGEGLHVDYLTQRVRQYVVAAGLEMLAVTEIRRNLARRSACRRRDVLTRRRRGLRDYFLGFGFLACSSAARRR